MIMDPVFLDVKKLGSLIKDKELSPTELTHTFLERLQNIGSSYNSTVTVTHDLAIKQASKAEQEIIQGMYRGPLHGIPYGLKDLFATGVDAPTTWGAYPFRNRTFDHNATVVTNLKNSGAILVAKLAMIEMAGGMGYNQPNASFTGPCRNPWNKDRWAGGSSSGSGSAVGSGIVPFAIGTETWGSILTPASYCGVTGLRPTFGRVSRYGAMTLSWSLDKVGPIALTADDCGTILETISVPDHLDSTTPFKRNTLLHLGLRDKVKLAVIKDNCLHADKDTKSNFLDALSMLNTIADIEEITLPNYPYEAIIRTILLSESASALEDFTDNGTASELTAQEDRYGPYARTTIAAKDYIKALRLRGKIAEELDNIMANFDCIISPSRPSVAPQINRNFDAVISDDKQDEIGALSNLLGLPAISVPNGFSDISLPTGIQFIGRPNDENSIIDVASWYQMSTRWHDIHPKHLLHDTQN